MKILDDLLVTIKKFPKPYSTTIGFTKKLFLLTVIGFLSFSSCLAKDSKTPSPEQKQEEEKLLEYSGEDYERVKAIVKKIANYIGTDPNSYKISIRSAKDFNASATFGKHLTIHSSLFHLLKTEAGLATIVAHEMGHIERKHLVKGMSTSIAVGVLGGVASALTGSSLVSSASQDVSNIAVKAHSRSQERSADLFAIDLMNKLYCASPGKIEGYKLMLAKEKNVSYAGFLRTHPMAKTRLDYMITLIEDAGCEV